MVILQDEMILIGAKSKLSKGPSITSSMEISP